VASAADQGAVVRQSPWILSWVVVLAFATRAAARWYLGAADFWTNGYIFFFSMAQSIAGGRGMTHHAAIASRVPLYPAFLAVITFGHKAFLPILFAQSLIGAATVL